MILYGIFIMWITIFSREKTEAFRYNIAPFWEYAKAFEFSSDGLRMISKEWLNIILSYIYMFVPLRFAIPRLRHLKRDMHILIAFSVHICIEFVQLITRRGIFETNDIIKNALGYLIGYAIWIAVDRMVLRCSKS